jgi:cell division protein FtsA
LDKAFSTVGVDVDSYVFTGLASSLAVLTDTEKELGVVLVDIGAGTTDISIYTDGSVSHSSALAIGSRHITNDLAIGLRISIESAEKIKLYLSDGQKKVLRPDDYEETRADKTKADELDLSSLGLPEELKKISHKTLVDGIIRPRLNEIFTMVGIEIKKSGFSGLIPAGVVVTGGGAQTVGLREAAKRTLAMPVRIAMPVEMKGIIDEIQSPAFSTVIGLNMYGAKNGQEDKKGLPFGLSVPKMGGGGSGKAVQRIINILKSFIP